MRFDIKAKWGQIYLCWLENKSETLFFFLSRWQVGVLE
jgi:hypothetical protein